MDRRNLIFISKDYHVDFNLGELCQQIYATRIDTAGLDSSDLSKVVYETNDEDKTKIFLCGWIESESQMVGFKKSYANNFVHIHFYSKNIKPEGQLAKLATSIINVENLSVSEVSIKINSNLKRHFSKTHSYVDVIIGGQYGSEGKGQVAAYLSHEYDILLRVGGPNAGHKVYEEPEPYTFHLLPSGSRTNQKATIVMGPGSVLNVDTILKEIKDLGVNRSVYIDPQCAIICEEDRASEKKLVDTIGSTGQGVGEATARRILKREKSTKLAKDVDSLKQLIKPTIEVLEEAYRTGKSILLEGTQGSSLSLYHGAYPYVTSRDTNVSGCLAEAGIPPRMVRKVILVCRTYPIRVESPLQGSSGPLKSDIEWKVIAERSGIPVEELQKKEKTSTTKKKRRVSEFCWDQFHKSCLLNMPTDIALTFVDYFSVENRECCRFDQLSLETKEFCNELEKVAGCRVSLFSSNFHFQAMIDRRSWEKE